MSHHRLLCLCLAVLCHNLGDALIPLSVADPATGSVAVHPCDTKDKGGCAQVCNKIGENAQGKFECSCAVKWKLLDDGKKCDLETPGDYRYYPTSDEVGKCVDNANSYRRKHEETPDMEWDEDLAKGATDWAQHIVANMMKKNDGGWHLQHAPWKVRKAGENLEGSFHPEKFEGCIDANKNWYNEVNNWNFTSGWAKTFKENQTMYEGFYKIGHFTQVVWKGTLKFGIGVAIEEKYPDPKVIVVGRYLRPGNFGSFSKWKNQVRKLKKT